MECKNCGRKFHYCTSCDHDPISDLGFCSDECFEASEEFIKNTADFILLVDSLNNKNLIFLYKILSQISEEYYGYFIDLIMEKFKEDL